MGTLPARDPETRELRRLLATALRRIDALEERNIVIVAEVASSFAVSGHAVPQAVWDTLAKACEAAGVPVPPLARPLAPGERCLHAV